MSESNSNLPEFSVGEISFALKRTVEDAYGYVRVRGEITGFRGAHSSGHAYFALKDEKARLEAVIWRGQYNKLKIKPEEGLEIVATGKLTTYPGSSKYQLVIEHIEPAGIGALMALLEERRRKFAAEGLFDAERKLAIPYLPRVIGVVTSPTGAVIRDIMHRIHDRFPVHVIVWPVRVQGESSEQEVAAAIRGFNTSIPGGTIPRPDLLIVARGGGSLEDLWSFNGEEVIRAAAESKIPLISAVGHETDWTLLDHVADKRAPTPTGAAEMAVPVRSELMATTDDLARRHQGALIRLLEQRRQAVHSLARALPSLQDLLALPRQYFDDVARRLTHALKTNTKAHASRLGETSARLSVTGLMRSISLSRTRLEGAINRSQNALRTAMTMAHRDFSRTQQRLNHHLIARTHQRSMEKWAVTNARLDHAFKNNVVRLSRQLLSIGKMLQSLSHHAVLARGFALVRDHNGMPLRSIKMVVPGSIIDVELADGHMAAKTMGGSVSTSSLKQPAKVKQKLIESQGSLFDDAEKGLNNEQ